MIGGESERAHCPRCQSDKVWRDGLRKNRDRVSQRFFCCNCNYRFSDSRRSLGFSASSEIGIIRQVCDGESKNLIVVPENGTTGDISTTNGQLLDYSFYLYKESRAESTIKSRVQILRSLVNAGASLMDPESVKFALAQINWVPKRKVNAVDAYDIFVKRYGLTWTPPRYRVPRNNPFVPTEKD